MEYYPAFYYHQTEKPKIVRNEAERLALGGGWVDSPAKLAATPSVEGEEVIASQGSEQAPVKRGPGRPRKVAP